MTVIRKSCAAVVLLFCCLWLAGKPAGAQMITLNYFVPENIDPNEVVTFSNTTPFNIAGDDLVTGSPLTKGVEIHSAMPGSHGGILDIDSVILTLHYNGPLQVVSNGFGTYQPWDFSVAQVGDAYTITFDRTTSPGLMAATAPINNNYVPGQGNMFRQSFATLTIVAPDKATENSFIAQNPDGSIPLAPRITGTERTPEPGALAFLTGLSLTAGVLAAARLRRRA